MSRSALPEILETERLVLRPFALTDVDDVFAYAQDPEWSRYLRMLPRPYLESDAEKFIARQLLLDRVRHPAWAIVLDDAAVGGINLRFDFEHRLAELGYSLARAEWGNGYGSEAARAVIDAAFRAHEDLERIHARADVRNGASQRVMEKVGMRREGVLRKSRVERGEALDEVWYAVLREEWERGSARDGSAQGDRRPSKVNLAEKLSRLGEPWTPRLAARVNETDVKLVKLEGEFVWHRHEAEDELFLVLEGRMLMQFRDHEEWVEEGEFILVPRGVEHRPVAPEQVHVLLIEPAGTLNTGDVRSERTVDEVEPI